MTSRFVDIMKCFQEELMPLLKDKMVMQNPFDFIYNILRAFVRLRSTSVSFVALTEFRLYVFASVMPFKVILVHRMTFLTENPI